MNTVLKCILKNGKHFSKKKTNKATNMWSDIQRMMKLLAEGKMLNEKRGRKGEGWGKLRQ